MPLSTVSVLQPHHRAGPRPELSIEGPKQVFCCSNTWPFDVGYATEEIAAMPSSPDG